MTEQPTTLPRYRLKGQESPIVEKTGSTWAGLVICRVIVPGPYEAAWQGEGVRIYVEEGDLEAV